MILEWVPSIREGSILSNLIVGKFTQSQEECLLRCFHLFDLDEDGKLTAEDLTRVRW